MVLSANIAGLKIDPAIMNASGIFSFIPVLEKISEFEIGALVAKSVCSEERPGFETPIFAKCSKEAYVNAVGLPGSGHISLKKELEKHYPLKKPLIVSIFESSEEKLAGVAEDLENYCDAFELNLSCPNLKEGEKIGMIIGRDPMLVKSYTKSVKERVNKPIIVKLPPSPYIEDKKRIQEIALAAAEHANAISAINTVAGGMRIDIRAKRPVLNAKWGGVSGKAIKPIGIGCVYSIYEAISKNYDIPIIGMGGIETAEDIIEYVEAGASAVAIGTNFLNKPLGVVRSYLSTLVTRLEEILEDLSVNKLQDLVGVAHV